MKMRGFALRAVGLLVLWMLHCGSEQLAAAVPPGQWRAHAFPFLPLLSTYEYACM